MWIKIKDGLINMDTVSAVSMDQGLQDKFVLHFHQFDGQNTGHVPFDTEEEAKAAFAKIEAIVNVALRFPGSG